MLFRLRSFLQLIDIGMLWRVLSKTLIMFAMLGLLYSCGSNSSGEDNAEDTATTGDNGNGDGGGDDAVDDGRDTTIITPPDDTVKGEFSFDQKNYIVSVGGTVDITIKVEGEPIETAFSIVLQEQINGANVPSTLHTFSEGQTEYVYSYDAAGNRVGSIIKLAFQDLPTGYVRASSKPITITVEPNSISFANATYTVQAGKEVELTLQITSELTAQALVPIRIYDSVTKETFVETAAITAGETSTTLSYLAASSRAPGTIIEYSIGELPSGLSLGENPTAEVRIEKNPDLPDIVVNFSKNSYSVLAGQLYEVEVKLTSELPLAEEITIPYEYRAKGSNIWTTFPVTFEIPPGETLTPDTASFTYNATTLASGDGGEFRMTNAAVNAVIVNSGGTAYGVSLGQPNTADITVVGKTVGFKDANLSVEHTANALITVQLEDPASSYLAIPLIINSTRSNGIAQIENVSVAFEAGEQQRTYIYSTADRLPGSTITFSFGDLTPAGYVVAIGKGTSTVTLDTDQISFSAGVPINIEVPNNTSYNLSFSLSQPRYNQSQIPLKITTNRIDGTTFQSTDSVSIPATHIQAFYNFFASKYNYSIGDEIIIAIDEAKIVGTGLTLGSDTTPRKLTIVGSNTVEFVNAHYEITLGDAVDIPIQLQKSAVEQINLTVEREFKDVNGNVIASAGGTQNVSFAVGTTVPSVGISYDTSLSTILGTMTYSFINVPDDIGVAKGKATSVVDVTDKRLSFEKTSYDLRTGDKLDVKLLIATAPPADNIINLIKTTTIPGTPPVVTTENFPVTLLAGQSSVTFEYDAAGVVTDTTVEYKIDAANLPADVVLGNDDTTLITVKADKVEFAEATYTVRAGDEVDIEVTLTATLTHSYPFDVELQVSSDNGVTSSLAGSVTFTSSTDTSKIFTYQAPAAAGTQIFSFGNLPIGLVGGNTSEITVTNSDIAFIPSIYDVRAGDTVNVRLQLASPATSALTVPLSVVASDGSTPGPANILFDVGDSFKTFTYLATSAKGTVITYSLGDLSGIDGLTAAAVGADGVITVQDSDIRFEFTNYQVRADLTKTIKVVLESPASKDMSILINTPGAKTSTSSVAFTVGDTEKTFDYVADTVTGSNVLSFGLLPVGVTAAGTSTIEIKDSGVKFEFANNPVRAGDSVDIKVILATAPEAGSSFNIPLIVSPDSAASGSVTFAATETEKIFTYTAGLAIGVQTVTFGTLPAGVTAGAPTTITITDSGIRFGSTTYSVRAGDTVDITVSLSSDAVTALNVPINTTFNSLTTYLIDATYIVGGSKDFIFSYTAPATTGDYALSFAVPLPAGVTAGNSTVVTVVDSDVNFEFASYTLRAGDTINIKASLASPATSALSIPISATGGATLTPSSVAIADTDSDGTFAYTAPTTAGTYALSFGSVLPAGVTAGGTSTVVVTDSNVEFEFPTYSVRAGNSIDVKVELASAAIVTDPSVPLVIPISASGGTGGSVSFANNDTSKTFSYTGPALAGSYTLSFGVLPSGVSSGALGTNETASVNVTDSGLKFGASTYIIRANDVQDIKVELTSNALVETTIIVNTPGGTNATETVIIPVGQKDNTFSYTAPAATGVHTLSFNSFPANVELEGTVDTTELTIVDSGIQFKKSTDIVRSNSNVNIDVELVSNATRLLTIPLLVSFNDGTNIITSNASVTVSNGTKSGTLVYTAPAITGDYTFSFPTSDTNFPTGVTPSGVIDETVITVTDSGIDFEFATYSVRAGDTIDIKVVLKTAPIAGTSYTVPLKITPDDTDASVTFNAGITEVLYSYTAPATAGERTLAFNTADTNFPDEVTAGTATKIDVIDSGIQFKQSTYTVISGNSINIEVKLVENATRDLTIPIAIVFNDGVTIINSSSSVSITNGTKSGVFSYTGPNIAGDYTFSFPTSDTNFPKGVIPSGVIDETVVTVTDNSVSFDSVVYNVRAGDKVNIKVKFGSVAVSNLPIPLKGTRSDDGTIFDETVTIISGTDEGTFEYDATSDVKGTTISYTFDEPNFPVGVTLGILNTATTVTVRDSNIAFDAATYKVRSGDSVSVGITLASAAIVADPLVPLNIPLLVSYNGGSTSSAGSVSFADGDTSKTFSYTGPATHGTYQLSFDLTGIVGVTSGDTGTHETTDITVTDSAINFESSSYPVRAGTSVDVKVKLASLAITALNNVPITVSPDTASNGTVSFAVGADEAIFTYTATTAGTQTLSFGDLSAIAGLTAGSDATITVGDSNIAFNKASETVLPGVVVPVGITLASAAIVADPLVPLNIPLLVSIDNGATTSSAGSVSFDDGDTTATFNYTAPATPDTYQLSFDLTGIAGVTSGATGTNATIDIIVVDGGITFELSKYPVRAGTSVDIKVKLATPTLTALNNVPITVSPDTASNGTVSFAINDDEAIFTYTAGATPSTQTLSFGDLSGFAGLAAGSDATINVGDSNIAFDAETYRVRASDSINVQVNLASAAIVADPLVPLNIPLLVSDDGGVTTSSAGSVSFDNNDISASFVYTAPITDGVYQLSFDLTGIAGVTSGAPATHETTDITVDDARISFEFATYDVVSGGTIGIKAILKSAATRNIIIPLDATAGTTGTLAFSQGNTEVSFAYTAPASIGTQTISFGSSLPAGVIATSPTTISVNNGVAFGAASYNVGRGGVVQISIDLLAAVSANTDIPLLISHDNGVTTEALATVTMLSGNQQISYDYTAPNSLGDKIISFGSLPNGISKAGTIDETKITVQENNIFFAETNYTHNVGPLNIAIKVKLTRPATERLKVTFDLNNGSSWIANYKEVIFEIGDTEQTFLHDYSSLLNALPFTYTYRFHHDGTDNLGSITAATSGDSLYDPPSITVATTDILTVSAGALIVGFEQPAYDVTIGSAIDIPLKLNKPATGVVDIPVEIDGVTNTVTFGIGDHTKILTYHTGTEVAGTTATYALGTLPNNVYANTHAQTIVTVTDTGVSFSSANYGVRAGDTVTITAQLESVAKTNLIIPVNVTDGSVTPLEFPAGEDTVTFTYTAPATAGNQTLTFGSNLPIGITPGNITSAVVLVTDSAINFVTTASLLNEGAVEIITVRLASLATRDIEVPINVSVNGGATSNYSTVSIPAGETDGRLFINGDAGGNTLPVVFTYGFGTLPTGVTAGTDDELEVTLVESNVVIVNFVSEIYNVSNSQTVNIIVELHKPAVTAVDIPLTLDGSFVENINIGVGDTQGIFIYTAPATDGTHIIGFDSSNPSFPSNVLVGKKNPTATVLVSNAVNFDVSALTVRAGDTIDIAASLDVASVGTQIVPLIVPAGSATPLSFVNSNTATFTYTAPTIMGIYRVRFDNANLPAGLVLGSDNMVTITVLDSAIKFTTTAYTIRNNTTLTNIQVELVENATKVLDIPIIRTHNGVADTPFNVTIAAGTKTATFDYAASVVSASFPTDVRFGFGILPSGVNEGVDNEVLVTVNDSRIAFVASDYNGEPGDAIDVTIQLASPAIIIPPATSYSINVTNDSDSSVQNFEFADGETAKTFTHNIPNSVNLGDTVTYSIDTSNLPDGVTQGDNIQTTILAQTSIQFAQTSNIAYSGVAFGVTLTLDSATTSNTSIEVTASPASLSIANQTVTIPSGVTSHTFAYTAPTVTSDTDVTLGFAALPAGLVVGATSTSTLNVFPARKLSFTTVNHSAKYPAEETAIELSVDNAFSTETTLIVKRLAQQNLVTDLAHSTDLTFIFAAGDTKISVTDTAPQLDDSYSMKYEVDLTKLPYNTGVKASHNSSNYAMQDYQFDVPNTASYNSAADISANVKYDAVIQASAGDVVQLPITLNENLIAKTSHSLTVYNTAADAALASQLLNYSNFGVVGQKEQFFDFTLPATSDTDYFVKLVIDADKDGLRYTGSNNAGGKALYIYKIVGDNIVTFEQATYKHLQNNPISIKVKLAEPTINAVSIPVTVQLGVFNIVSWGSADFAANSDEATFSTNGLNSTVFDYTFRFDTLPSGNVLGVPATATLSVIQPTLSFKDTNYSDVYVNDTQEIALELNTEIAPAATIPLIRTVTSLDGIFTYATHAVTASFLAGETTSTVDAGANNATTAPNHKDRKVTYSFDTTHADWPTNYAVDSSKNQTGYNVKAYQYGTADEIGGSWAQVLTGVTAGQTINVPIVLDEALKTKSTFKISITYNQKGTAIWSTPQITTVENHGVIGQTAQIISFQAPAVDFAGYYLNVSSLDHETMNSYDPPGDADETYYYDITTTTPSHIISFNTADYGDVYINATQDIALTVTNAFAANTVIPLIRTVTSTDGNTVHETQAMEVTFTAGTNSTSLAVADRIAPVYKDSIVTFTSGNGAFPVDTAFDNSKNSSEYNLLSYIVSYPAEDGGSHHNVIGDAGDIIDVPFILDAALQAKSTFQMRVRHNASGSYNAWQSITLTSHGVVGQTEQSFQYTLPATSATTYNIEFETLATAWLTQGSNDDYNFEIIANAGAPNVTASFGQGNYGNFFLGETADVEVKLSHGFTDAKNLILTRRKYSGITLNNGSYTLGGVTGIDFITVSFAAGAKTAIIKEGFQAGVVYNYRFAPTHLSWPSDVTAPTSQSQFGMFQATVSFNNANETASYVSTDTTVSLVSNHAFVKTTDIALIRKVSTDDHTSSLATSFINGSNISTKLTETITARFDAGQNTGYIVSGDIVTPLHRNKLIGYEFGTLITGLQAGSVTRSAHKAIGYDMYYPGNPAIQTVDLITTPGSVVQVPIYLTEALQSKTSFSYRVNVRVNGVKIVSNQDIYLHNFGDVGQTQQYAPYNVPSFSGGDTVVVTFTFDRSGNQPMGEAHTSGADRQGVFNYNLITPPTTTNVNFDIENHGNRYPNNLPAPEDITLTVQHAFPTTTDLPVSRTVNNANAVSVVARFLPYSTTGFIIDNTPPAYQNGAIVRYTLDINHADWPDNLVRVGNSARYVMDTYQVTFADEVVGNSSGIRDISVENQATIVVPFTLNTNLKAKTNFIAQVKHNIWGVDSGWYNVSFTNHGDVGQTEQSFNFTLPNSNGDNFYEFRVKMKSNTPGFVNNSGESTALYDTRINISTDPVLEIISPVNNAAVYIGEEVPLGISSDTFSASSRAFQLLRYRNGNQSLNASTLNGSFPANQTTTTLNSTYNGTFVAGQKISHRASNGFASGTHNLTMTNYRLYFPDEPEQGYETGRHTLTVVYTGYVTVNFKLDVALKNVINVKFWIRNSTGGNWHGWQEITRSINVVHGTSQSFSYQTPATNDTDYRLQIKISENQPGTESYYSSTHDHSVYDFRIRR